MSRYLFLDFDGVLCTNATYDRWPHRHQWATPGWSDDHLLFGEEQVERLNRIVRATGAHVVLSTAWREQVPFFRLLKLLRQVGVEAVPVGCTPSLGDRADEIDAWMAKRGIQPRQVVILEDVEDMEHLEFRTVRSSMAGGLQEVHVARAVGLFT